MSGGADNESQRAHRGHDGGLGFGRSVIGNSIVDNAFAFGCGNGTIASTGDNRTVNNPYAGCAPGAAVTVQ